MSDEERRSRQGDYRLARIVVAGVMSLLLATLLILDAVRTDYEVQLPTVVIISTMILALLAVEGLDRLRGGS